MASCRPLRCAISTSPAARRPLPTIAERDRGEHEREAMPPGAKEQSGEQHAEREGRQQEAQTGAGLGDVEGRAGDANQEAVEPDRNAQRVEQADRERGRERLERRDQAVAERHRQIEVEQRKGDLPEDGGAEDRKRRRLEERDERQLLDHERRDHLPDGREERRGADQRQPPRPGPRRHLPQRRAPLPEQERDHRRHQHAVAVSRRADPGESRPRPARPDAGMPPSPPTTARPAIAQAHAPRAAARAAKPGCGTAAKRSADDVDTRAASRST